MNDKINIPEMNVDGFRPIGESVHVGDLIYGGTMTTFSEESHNILADKIGRGYNFNKFVSAFVEEDEDVELNESGETLNVWDIILPKKEVV